MALRILLGCLLAAVASLAAEALQRGKAADSEAAFAFATNTCRRKNKARPRKLTTMLASAGNTIQRAYSMNWMPKTDETTMLIGLEMTRAPTRLPT